MTMVSARASSYLPGVGLAARPSRRGVLPYQHLLGLVEAGAIAADDGIDELQVQPASIDLRLGDFALQVRASFLPGRRSTVLDAAAPLAVQKLDLAAPQVLQKGAVYIVPLLESLHLPPDLFGKGNPKSTTGRLDVFARLITDFAEHFDTVRRGYSGRLFVEVAPKTFSIIVRRGSKLNQLRLLRGLGTQSDASQKAARAGEALAYSESGEPLRATVSRGLWLTVDLRGSGEGGIIGWKAIENAPVIDFDRTAFYDPEEFWQAVRVDAHQQLILSPGDFYILGSRERVRVPPTFAAEMVPYDPAMGEFRVHYAGFFDPGFGYGRGELQGTRGILEVRSHDVPYVLRDGQHIARLLYERLLEPPHKLYGINAGSSYQFQRLGLGRQFRDPG